MKRTFVNEKKTYRITATAQLSWLRGNAKPYFSLTAEGRDHGSEFGGCCHDEILKHWPDLKPLADLHLSDIDGIPMHAEANGWYNLCGALGGLGETYHVGNSDRHMPCTPPEGKPWQKTEYRHPTADECVQIFANHCRISLQEAQDFIASLVILYSRDIREQWRTFCKSLEHRWLIEAKTAIEQFGLERPSAPC